MTSHRGFCQRHACDTSLLDRRIRHLQHRLALGLGLVIEVCLGQLLALLERRIGSGYAHQQQGTAMVRILSGANAGRELALVKALTTIGRPGHQVAVITRRPTGYFIAHVEGDLFPLVNGHNLGSAAHPLKDKDVIELAGVRMEFSNPAQAPAPTSAG